MRGWGICHHHHEVVLVVFEEVKDAFFFHQPGTKVEIGFAVLNAIVALLEGPLNRPLHLEAGKDLFKDVRNGDVLENPASRNPCGEPEGGHDLSGKAREVVVSIPLDDSPAYAAKVALLASNTVGAGIDQHRHGEFFAKQRPE